MLTTCVFAIVFSGQYWYNLLYVKAKKPRGNYREKSVRRSAGVETGSSRYRRIDIVPTLSQPVKNAGRTIQNGDTEMDPAIRKFLAALDKNNS